MSSKEIEEEIAYISETIRKGLGVNIGKELDSALAQEIAKKQFLEDQEILKSVIGKKIKEQLIAKGIDPDTVKINWDKYRVSYSGDSIVVEDIPFVEDTIVNL